MPRGWQPSEAVHIDHGHNRNGPARVRPNRWAGRGGNRLLERSAIRVFTADHPPSHASLSANQPGTAPFDQGVVGWIMQTLWPVHCVQGSHGAAFHHRLASKLADLILRNGIRPELDSYSAFYENDRQTSRGLDGYLRGRGVDVVAIVGLALDHCSARSSEDAVHLGYRTRVLLAGCRAINRGGSLERAIASMRQVGVALETSVELG